MAIPRTVLVVDDAEDFRRFVSIILKPTGVELVEVTNGREALDYLMQHDAPTMILLDLRMPVMNGWEFLEHQAKSPALAAIPVVVCSSEPGISKSKFASPSVVACLSKFLEPDQVVYAVEAAMKPKLNQVTVAASTSRFA